MLTETNRESAILQAKLRLNEDDAIRLNGKKIEIGMINYAEMYYDKLIKRKTAIYIFGQTYLAIKFLIKNIPNITLYKVSYRIFRQEFSKYKVHKTLHVYDDVAFTVTSFDGKIPRSLDSSRIKAIEFQSHGKCRLIVYREPLFLRVVNCPREQRTSILEHFKNLVAESVPIKNKLKRKLTLNYIGYL